MKNIFIVFTGLGLTVTSALAGNVFPEKHYTSFDMVAMGTIPGFQPKPQPAPAPKPVAAPKPLPPPQALAPQPVVQAPTPPVQPTSPVTQAPPATTLPLAPAPPPVQLPVVDAVTSLTSLLTDKVFAANSFWYTPIPANVPYHPNNTNLVNEFNRQRVKWFNTVEIATKSWASPVYVVPANQPQVAVGWNDCQKKGYADKNFLSQVNAVPIPSHATEAGGTDKEMTIYQPATDTIWELWGAKKDANNKWYACWGGKLANASRSEGRFPKGYGTTASGLPFIGGQITAEELKRGEIKHAIGIALVDVEHFTIYSYPANRSDGWNPTRTPNRIAEGQRFRLDPKINVDALKIPKAGKIIAKAGQKYGFIVWDKAGAITVRAQNPFSYATNPYPALFENKQSYEILKGIPWDRIQFLPFDYGKPTN
jgi:hypothetical protein